MSLQTPSSVVRSILTGRWKDALIGAAALLLTAVVSWVMVDTVALRDKLRSLPEASQIVTSQQVDQRFQAEDKKLDDNIVQTHESLGRIEGKIDTLVMSLATRRRPPYTPGAEDPDYSSRGVPSSRVITPEQGSQVASRVR